MGKEQDIKELISYTKQLFPNIKLEELKFRRILKKFSWSLESHAYYILAFIKSCEPQIQKKNAAILLIDPTSYCYVLLLIYLIDTDDVTLIYSQQSYIDRLRYYENYFRVKRTWKKVLRGDKTWIPNEDGYDVVLACCDVIIPGILHKLVVGGGCLVMGLLGKDYIMKGKVDAITGVMQYYRKLLYFQKKDNILIHYVMREPMIKFLEEVQKQLTLQITSPPVVDEVEIYDYQCPICLNVFGSPIYTCTNGHSVCNSCKQSLHSCPHCRNDQFFRDLNLEKTIKKIIIPCKSCHEEFPGFVYNFHESNCKAAQSIRCQRCNAFISASQYIEHIENEFGNLADFCFKLEFNAKQLRIFNDARFYTRTTHVFEWFVHLSRDTLTISVKLLAEKKFLLSYEAEVKIVIQKQLFKYSNVASCFDMEDVALLSNPVVKIPNCDDLVKNGVIKIAGHARKV